MFLDLSLIPEYVLLSLFIESLDLLVERKDLSLPEDFKGLYWKVWWPLGE